jgi:mono/diheme cytochrome c family protein
VPADRLSRAQWLVLVTAFLAITLLTLAGCDNMANQPKRLPYETYRDHPTAPAHWEEPAGTVARDASPEPPPMPTITTALLERGRQRFEIYCSVCHGQAGYGDGQIVQRGFPAPPSYHSDRLRHAPNQHFYDVITNGYGAMFSYAQRVAPPDRWAIVAYIRALQASQNMPVAQLTPGERANLPAQSQRSPRHSARTYGTAEVAP